MMKDVVAYQSDNNVLKLPSVEEMVSAAEAYLKDIEQSYASDEDDVMMHLTDQSKEALTVLDDYIEEKTAEDQNMAATPQLENIQRLVEGIRKIYEEARKVWEETNAKRDREIQENHLLRKEIKNLRGQKDAPKRSPGLAMLKKCGERVATYAADPHHPRVRSYEYSNK